MFALPYWRAEAVVTCVGNEAPPRQIALPGSHRCRAPRAGTDRCFRRIHSPVTISVTRRRPSIRAMCAITWIASAIASRMLRCGRPTFAVRDAMRQPRECLARRVRMDRAQAAKMSRIEGLQQIERLRPAHLADENAIGPMPKGGAEQIGNGHRRQWQLPGRAALVRVSPRVARRSACPDGSQRFPRSQRCGRRQECARPGRSASVVLPVPVPPEIRMFRCWSTAARS